MGRSSSGWAIGGVEQAGDEAAEGPVGDAGDGPDQTAQGPARPWRVVPRSGERARGRARLPRYELVCVQLSCGGAADAGSCGIAVGLWPT